MSVDGCRGITVTEIAASHFLGRIAPRDRGVVRHSLPCAGMTAPRRTGGARLERRSPLHKSAIPIWIGPLPWASVLSNRLKSRHIEGEQREI